MSSNAEDKGFFGRKKKNAGNGAEQSDVVIDNLQPLDFSGRSYDGAPQGQPFVLDSVVGAAAGQSGAASETAVPTPSPVKEPASAPAAESQPQPAEQEPVAVQPEPEPAAEPEAGAASTEDTAAAAAAGPEAAIAPSGQQEPSQPVAALDGNDQEPVVLAEEGAAAYSRANAHYEHRGGWAGLETWQKRLVVIVVIVIALVAACAGAALALWQNTNDQVQIQDEELQESLTSVEDETIDPYWTLILGSDSRDESKDRARSDVIILARIDPNTPRVTLVSIPRDTKVTIEGYGTQKINAAYALGGAKLAISTIEDYSGVKISHYVEIYFSGLEDLVDQLGGVTVDVPEYCKYSDVELKPGEQTLTGHEALIFARCRKTYSQGDFTRTKCQRILVTALAKKVLDQDATKLASVVSSVAKCFKTDMSLQDLISLAQRMQGMDSSNFYSGMAPSDTGMVDGVSYTFTCINQWKAIMQKAEAGKKPTLNSKEKEICGWTTTSYTELDMKDGLPSDIQTKLDKYWAKQEKKAAAKAAKKLEEQQGSSGSEESTDTSDNEASAA